MIAPRSITGNCISINKYALNIGNHHVPVDYDELEYALTLGLRETYHAVMMDLGYQMA